jgi:predicted secreted hydrolase
MGCYGQLQASYSPATLKADDWLMNNTDDQPDKLSKALNDNNRKCNLPDKGVKQLGAY